MLTEYTDFSRQVESSSPNPARARVVVNGEYSLLVLAGIGGGKTSVPVAHANWLPTRGEASLEQVLLLAFGRKAAEEMDERIREQLYAENITAHMFHVLVLHITQQGSKKVPVVSRLENDTAACHELFIAEQRKQCSGKKVQAKD